MPSSPSPIGNATEHVAEAIDPAAEKGQPRQLQWLMLQLWIALILGLSGTATLALLAVSHQSPLQTISTAFAKLGSQVTLQDWLILLGPLGLTGPCVLMPLLAGVSLWTLNRYRLRQEQDQTLFLKRQSQKLQQALAQNASLREQLSAQAILCEQLAEQLQQAEAVTLQSEKMATLGVLIAGVAHEINTPLGAIQASAENLVHSASQSLEQLPNLLIKLTPEQLPAFIQLITWAGQNTVSSSSREERKLKRSIKKILEELDVPNARRAAETLSQMGIRQELHPLLPLLKSEQASFFLDSAYNFSTVRANADNISLAIERAITIVAALRNYSRKGSQVKPTMSSLAEGLDTVLTLYQNKLKHGIEVKKHYEPVPQLLCYPEELDQVWSNLIGNAIQAMGNQGVLALSLCQKGQMLVVTITDSGPGIPSEVKDKIFSPYFTTKPMGQGSGLGLSISQKIISRHCGLIDVDSQPGQTTFRVCLPIGSGVREAVSSPMSSNFLSPENQLSEAQADDVESISTPKVYQTCVPLEPSLGSNLEASGSPPL